MSESKCVKMMGHKQLFLFSLIFSSIFWLFFLLPAIFSDSPIFFFIVGQIFSAHYFLVFFSIFHRAFFTVKIDENKISVGKRVIKWEEIALVKLKEQKIWLRRSLIHPKAIYFNSYVCVFDKNGHDIRFALNKKSYGALLQLGAEKSPKIKELLDKTSV